MLRKVDFESAYRAGRRYGNSFFSLTVRPNSLEHPRLGLAVAARTIGNAVARNRLRRLVRESFRLAQSRLPAADLIVGARVAASDAPPERLREALERLWTQLAAACAKSSTP